MTRDEYADKVYRVLACFEQREKLNKNMLEAMQSRKSDERMITQKAIDANEVESKAAIIDIAVDVLYDLHRIANALDGDEPLLDMPVDGKTYHGK